EVQVDELVCGVDDCTGDVVGNDVAVGQPRVRVAFRVGVFGSLERCSPDQFEGGAQVCCSGGAAGFAACSQSGEQVPVQEISGLQAVGDAASVWRHPWFAVVVFAEPAPYSGQAYAQAVVADGLVDVDVGLYFVGGGAAFAALGQEHDYFAVEADS